VLVARGRGLAAAGARLAGRAGVRAVAPFGAAQHQRVDPARLDGAGVAAALRQAGAEAVEVEDSEPTQEDVFLAVVDRSAGGAP
jgi:ABC-2 type transport system ATP-binding protein